MKPSRSPVSTQLTERWEMIIEAAKVEETHVPLLLDFQVEDCKYMFESKIIQRMDFWFVHYLPSVIAAVVMKNVIKEIEPCEEYHNRITSALIISEEKMDDCYGLITEIIDGHDYNLCHKRKHELTPGSPSVVIDAYFSSDSSNDSWAGGKTLDKELEAVEGMKLRRGYTSPYIHHQQEESRMRNKLCHQIMVVRTESVNRRPPPAARHHVAGLPPPRLPPPAAHNLDLTISLSPYPNLVSLSPYPESMNHRPTARRPPPRRQSPATTPPRPPPDAHHLVASDVFQFGSP
ncbi:cyclin-d3-2 [Phtheirospermum japonicum]|uniref:Cyclin-d3-2 n=1 Tax=Phtheirospermum japonicum TaxID=374723 RepID=A0A830BYU6_9LAMI|nr:cyclin-d3-2 [Phtheirospermum japonicum]